MAEDEVNEAQLPLDSVGVRLRRAREAAGLSRADLAATTKIPERHLSAIEEGNFAALPARTYAVGFSRSYARAVGLDDADIARSVRDELDGVDPEAERKLTSTFEPGDPARVPSGKLVWIAGLIAVIIIAAGSVLWRSFYAPAVSLPPLGEETQAAVPASPAPLAHAAVVDGPVVFTALEDGVWVKFYDGSGTQLMQKQMALGETYVVPVDAQGPQIWTARPQALSITIGEKPVAKLSEVQVTMKDVPVSAAALTARGKAMPNSPAAQSAVAPASPRPAQRQRDVSYPPRRNVEAVPPLVPTAAPVADPQVPAASPSTVTQ